MKNHANWIACDGSAAAGQILNHYEKGKIRVCEYPDFDFSKKVPDESLFTLREMLVNDCHLQGKGILIACREVYEQLNADGLELLMVNP